LEQLNRTIRTEHARKLGSASSVAAGLVETAQQLWNAVEDLEFRSLTGVVYNPLGYVWPTHEAYLRKFGNGRKRVVFLGMNPGPFGMAQTGVPFGELTAVRD